jgi:hypothetical protein
VTTWPTGSGVLVLPSGRRVRGAALGEARLLAPSADVVVALTGRPPRGLPEATRWVRWPDFRTPRATDDALDVLREAYGRCGEQRVLFSCRAGVGRTGTALAALAVLDGLPVSGAVSWVRSGYHPRAVETPGQRRWLERVLVHR